MKYAIKQFIPLITLILIIGIIYITNTHHIFTINWLKEKEISLSHYAKIHPFLSQLLYLVVYIISVTLVIPDSTILTLLGAMIFPFPEGLVLALFSETVGALLFFYIVHTAFGAIIMQKEHMFLKKLRKGFRHHSTSYLLFLRLSHIIPFWLTNTAAAYFRIPFWTFIWTTFVGVIPITYVIANAGHSLSKAFSENQVFTFEDIFTLQIKLALLAIGILALCPILFKKFVKKKNN